MARRRTSGQPHPIASGRRRYTVVEHTSEGGRKPIGRYDSGTVARGVADAARKMLPGGSSAWFTVHRGRRS